ncbi:MAG: hypothetical protein N2322_05135 [Terrimicrobiaceae bacterium]|nr:hypothetical protein [Terrimicrobiaceae bacterium]
MKSWITFAALALLVCTGCEMHPPRTKAKPEAPPAQAAPVVEEADGPAPKFFPEAGR